MVNYGTIKDCETSGYIEGNYGEITGTWLAGGIAGGAFGNSEVVNCVSLVGIATGRI